MEAEEPGHELPTSYYLPPTPEQRKLFEELDHRFIQAKENFRELAAGYIEKHLEEFRGYEMQGGLAQRGAAPNGGSAMPQTIPKPNKRTPSVS